MGGYFRAGGNENIFENVSLYNTTQTSSIRPTPILLMMGIST